ncbi:hypothetical protein D3C81_781450 [compost metagenome]
MVQPARIRQQQLLYPGAFRQECQLAAKAVAKCHGSMEALGRPAGLTERVIGKTLQQGCRDRNLETTEALDIGFHAFKVRQAGLGCTQGQTDTGARQCRARANLGTAKLIRSNRVCQVFQVRQDALCKRCVSEQQCDTRLLGHQQAAATPHAAMSQLLFRPAQACQRIPWRSCLQGQACVNDRRPPCDFRTTTGEHVLRAARQQRARIRCAAGAKPALRQAKCTQACADRAKTVARLRLVQCGRSDALGLHQITPEQACRGRSRVNQQSELTGIAYPRPYRAFPV